MKDKINSQNGTPLRQNKVMTSLVPTALFEEFNTMRKVSGKSISEVQREMVRDWIACERDLQRSAAELASKRDEVSRRIKELPNNIHHMDAYMKLFREHGGDAEFREAEATLERMRPAVEEFQARKENPDFEIGFCEPCMDEAWHDHIADRHLEVDWLRFRDYVLLNMEYCKLARRLTGSRDL